MTGGDEYSEKYRGGENYETAGRCWRHGQRWQTEVKLKVSQPAQSFLFGKDTNTMQSMHPKTCSCGEFPLLSIIFLSRTSLQPKKSKPSPMQNETHENLTNSSSHARLTFRVRRPPSKGLAYMQGELFSTVNTNLVFPTHRQHADMRCAQWRYKRKLHDDLVLIVSV